MARDRLIMAPFTIPSNNCLILILSYTCGKEEAILTHEYNLLCRRANQYFKKTATLNFFNMAPVKIVLNRWTDPINFFKNKVYTISRNHTIKLKLNVPLADVSEAICGEGVHTSEDTNRNE